MAWQMEQQLICPGCGLFRDETMDKERTFAYEAKAVRCHSCAAKARAAKQFTAGPHDPAGLMFSVTPVD